MGLQVKKKKSWNEIALFGDIQYFLLLGENSVRRQKKKKTAFSSAQFLSVLLKTAQVDFIFLAPAHS